MDPYIIALVSYKKRERETPGAHTEQRLYVNTVKSVFKPSGEVISEINVARTLILDFQLPEL